MGDKEPTTKEQTMFQKSNALRDSRDKEFIEGMKKVSSIDTQWMKSPERKEAWFKFMVKINIGERFDQSQEFANARHAFRKRINS